MDIVLQFRDYLFSQNNKPSPVTVKNYIADIRKFITWYENRARVRFVPAALTPEVIDAFEKDLIAKTNGTVPAIRSTKRYISSLRNFSRFLEQTGAIKANPFQYKPQTKPVDIDPWLLRPFANLLIADKASQVTVKNYIIDIKQFIAWLERVTDAKEEVDVQRFRFIDYYAVEQYKERLLKEEHFSPVSINRKLSSLRRYIRWLASKNLLEKQPTITDFVLHPQTEATDNQKQIPLETEVPLAALKHLPQEEPKPEQQPQSYSRFAPIRLLQKTGKLASLGFAFLLITPLTEGFESLQYLLWKKSGKNVFTPVKTILKDAGEDAVIAAMLPVAQQATAASIASSAGVSIAKKGLLISQYIKAKTKPKPYTIRNISKQFYAPLKISLEELTWSQRLLHHLKYTRPAWYRAYHEFPLVNHIHLAILILATTFAGIATYYIGYGGPQPSKQVLSAASNAPPRKLAFQGRLLDKTNTPITADTDLRFSLYNSPTATASALLWQEVQHIQPDKNGNFSATLGQKSTLTQAVFTSNPSLYVGIAVGTDTELSPREQIPTVGYAKSSQTLQGLKPITKTDKTANVILALDSSGNLTIGGSANPTFQATGGQFTLAGQAMLLTTTPGSNGNITIAPDGSGIIDLEKPIQNISNSNNATGVPGAVAVDDLLAVAASSSTRSALTVRQNSTGDIISGYSDTTAKFRVKSTGDVVMDGNLTMGGNTITTTNTSFGIANSSVINLSIGLNATAISLGGTSGVTSINNDLTVDGGARISGTTELNGLLTANKGIVIASGQNLKLQSLLPGTIPFIGASNELSQDSSAFTWSQPTKALNVTGSICLRSTAGACPGTSAGTIYASNTTVQAADLAENYTSHEPLEPGDVVMPEGLGDNQGITKTTEGYEEKVIGIISTNPGFTLNSDAKTNEAHPYLYPLALQGRVPLKVSTINGNIKTGDSLTTSPIPGVAMKATRSGQMIAKALEDYASTQSDKVGKIMAFVNISYTAPRSLMDANGNLTMADKLPLNESHGLNDSNKQTLGPTFSKAVALINAFDQSAIALKELTSETLTVTSSKVIIGGKNLSQYISDIIDTKRNGSNAINQPKELSEITNDLQIPLTPASQSALRTPTEEKVSAEASSSAHSPLYNSIGSASAEIATTETTPNAALPLPTQTPILARINQADIEASSAAALGLDKLNMQDVTVSDALHVLGRTTLSDLGVTGNFNIGLMSINGLQNDQNGHGFASINTSVGPLKFQSDGFNGVDFLNGKLTIDTKGNLNVFGTAMFAKDVTVKGTLAANVIAPVPGGDLVVSLGKNDKQSKMHVSDSAGREVVAISQDGDIAASGSGSFAGITIVRGAQADTSVTESTTNGSAGKGVIKAHQKERTIHTPFVTKQSLIYVTATSNTEHYNLYVARQIPSDNTRAITGSFTIQLPATAKSDVTFNWWIVN